MKSTCLLSIFLVIPACSVSLPPQEKEQETVRMTGGAPDAGKKAIERYGCTSCHTIPGLTGDANVGPPLNRVGSRVYVAGVLTNSPENMARWISNPPAVDAKTAMPNLSVTPDDLRDIVAYLYTLR